MILYFITGIILFTNVTLLTILVPGGPIENRDFSHMKGFTFWGFNIFLIMLGLVSIVDTYLIMLQYEEALYLSVGLGVTYIIVYLIDLAGLFPKSPTEMSSLLMLMEIVNTMVAVFLVILSFVTISL